MYTYMYTWYKDSDTEYINYNNTKDNLTQTFREGVEWHRAALMLCHTSPTTTPTPKVTTFFFFLTLTTFSNLPEKLSTFHLLGENLLRPSSSLCSPACSPTGPVLKLKSSRTDFISK